MWLWVIVVVVAIVHSLLIDDDKNQRIKDTKDEVIVKYTKMH